VISYTVVLKCRLRGIVDCGNPHKHIYQRAMLLVEQVKVSRGNPLVTCLLEGPAGRCTPCSTLSSSLFVSAETLLSLFSVVNQLWLLLLALIVILLM
jgi:hypothetical protein